MEQNPLTRKATIWDWIVFPFALLKFVGLIIIWALIPILMLATIVFVLIRLLMVL